MWLCEWLVTSEKSAEEEIMNSNLSVGGRKVGVDVSIALVTYRVREALDKCLGSLEGALGGLSAETTVIDNSPDLLIWRHLGRLDGVRRLRGAPSLGFGSACNLALRGSSGRYYLVLNPDTLLPPDSISQLVADLDSNTDVGIIGPQLIRETGVPDLAARRSVPTPWSAFTRFLYLGHLFPKSRIFGAYNLTYLAPDQRAEVDAVSGAFMLMRREVFENTGGFDQRFWMYGEDLDLSCCARALGWKVVYQPAVQVLHLKRSSSSQRRLRTRMEFYRAMVMFYRKHQADDRAPAFNFVVIVGICTMGIAALVLEVLREACSLGMTIRLRRTTDDDYK
jgi:hypothetical protein